MQKQEETIKNTRALGILKSLSKNESDQLRKNVSQSSDAQTRTERCIEFLLNHKPKEYDSISRQQLYTFVYGKGSLKETTLRNLFSDVYEYLLDFLGKLNFEKSIFRKLFVLEELQQRGLTKEVTHNYEKIKKQIDGQTGDEMRNLALFGATYFDYLFTLKNKVNAEDDNLPDNTIHNKLTESFLLLYVRILSASANLGACIGSYRPMRFHEEVESLLRKISPCYEIKLRLAIYEAHTNLMDEQKTSKVTELIESDEFGQLPYLIKQEITVYVLNLLNFNYIKSPATFGHLYIRVAEVLFKENLFLQNGYLPGQMFSDYAVIVYRIGMEDKCFQFIENYKKYLNPSEKEFWESYTLSMIYFHQQKYRECLQLLAQCKPFYFGQKLRIRILYLKIYFEKGEDEAFMHLADSFAHFLSDNPDLPEGMRQGSVEFVKCARKLLLLRNKNPRVNAFDLQQKIEHLPPASNKVWLQEMLDKLKKEKNRATIFPRS